MCDNFEIFLEIFVGNFLKYFLKFLDIFLKYFNFVVEMLWTILKYCL